MLSNGLILLYGSAMTNTEYTTAVAISKGMLVATTIASSAFTLYCSNFVVNSRFMVGSTSMGVIGYMYVIVGY